MDEVVFGRYRLVALIGEGGMGKVYKAHDSVIGRDVAIKVLPAELSTEPGYRERFRREAQIAARLTEPHIVPIYDTGEFEKQLYLVMPVVDGTDLHGLLARDGPMPPQRAVRVIEQLASALHAAHAVGLVHRDIKPSNALVSANDFTYLIDFGIAHDATATTKLTQTGTMVGTFAYMAPERFTSVTADARVDVYSLACVLFECLTGVQPYPGDSMEQQIAGHLTKDPPKPSSLRSGVPAGLDAVIATGMAKKPDQRYQTTRELATAARQVLTSAPAPHPAPDPARQQATKSTPTPWQRRKPAKAGQVIERDRLGVLTKIGQGGQGVVYRAPNVKTKFAASMVYKEYKPQTRTEIDFTALAAMPALVEESLTYTQAERLISIAAWPCAIIQESGAPTGFVMPAIPDAFLIPLTTAKGVSTSTAEFQHLLNHPAVLAARGITIDDAQRFTLLRETASALAFLHKHGVCVGDISPKNLLFSLTPHEAVYFIDCDAMRINTVSALPQVETPGWNAPRGEELATIYSDTYKLGLLALRLIAGDHDTTNPRHLPATTPTLLRQVITDALTKQPHQRPLPEAWNYVLTSAIKHAQLQPPATTPDPKLLGTPPPPPSIPVVYSRPSAHSGPPVGPSGPPPSGPPPSGPPPSGPPPSGPPPSGPPPSGPPPSGPPPSGPPPSGPLPISPWLPPPTTPPTRSTSKTGLVVAIVFITVIGLIALIAVIAALTTSSNHASTTTTTFPYQSTFTNPPRSSTAPTFPTYSPTYAPSPTYTYTPEPTYVPPPPPPPPADMYAAIAVSDTGGYGWANNYNTMDAAKAAAMTRCRQNGGNCRLVAWRQNGCVALADGGRGARGWSSGSSLNEAEQSALAESHGGRILVSFCTSTS